MLRWAGLDEPAAAALEALLSCRMLGCRFVWSVGHFCTPCLSRIRALAPL
jgi:hypothetical protein